MNKLDKPLNTNERYLYEINVRLNVLIDMMDSFLDVYANQNGIATTNNEIEEVKEELEEIEGQITIEDIDYNELTISELKEMMDEYDIEYKANMRKSELIDLLIG